MSDDIEELEPKVGDDASQRLDLSEFSSVEEAMARTETSQRYRDVLYGVIPEEQGFAMSWELMFLQSMISRAQGLHEAISREIRHRNPHAVFPLLRALVESLALVIYVTDKPEYIAALISHPKDGLPGVPRRAKPQTLITHALKVAPGLKNVYGQLSEMTHFGAPAMWTSHVIDDEVTMAVSWTNEPRWRDDEQALIACATTVELADEMEMCLRRYAARRCMPGDEGSTSSHPAVNTFVYRVPG